MESATPTYTELVQDFEAIRFQADSALLGELGERLVGRADIALAELIKNAYDADATSCEVSIDDEEISVLDNGHGMSRDDFLEYWMTIGTRNKERRGQSRTFKRNVTGSKGVGRLSAQFLAHNLEMVTVSQENPTQQLRVFVDWNAAADAGLLMKAQAFYRAERRNTCFPEEKNHGTLISMKALKQKWTKDAIRDLGRQLWMLQSPIQEKTLNGKTDRHDFRIALSSPLENLEDTFDRQMDAVLDNHFATVSGEIKRDGEQSVVHVKVVYRTGEQYSENFAIDPLIERAKWHIRIFDLAGRQSCKIGVAMIRDYFRKFGGVQIYDSNFRLPYYGVDQDWLGIEYDHSHRKSRSKLLPERLQVLRGLNDLPAQTRIFGIVSIDTGMEARKAKRKKISDFLKVQITRDRLVGNQSYEILRDTVRWSLGYYAARQRLREQEKNYARQPKERADDRLERIRKLAKSALEAYPQDRDLAILAKETRHTATAVAKERAADRAAYALLSPLASAGMAALAFEHEIRKEIQRTRGLARRLGDIGKEIGDLRLEDISKKFDDMINQIEDSRKLFGPMTEKHDREEVEALAAAPVLGQVIRNVQPLLGGVRISVDVPNRIYLPAATFAEWSSLFQNVFLNAANATLDNDDRNVLCHGGRTKRVVWIRVEDNGFGVDYRNSEKLFEPFNRFSAVSADRRALGLGGTGLGLTIVRMIAAQRGAQARFVRPSRGWSTAFQLSWRLSR